MEKKNNMNMVIAFVIFLAVVGFLVFISLNKKSNMDSNRNIGVEETSEVAKPGDTVAMNYTGRLANGTVFDSNVDPKFNHVQPFEFTLGRGQVIPGWEKGIVGMKVGEKKTLVIPPEDAYGAAGVGNGLIPPNATLTFDVELLVIKK